MVSSSVELPVDGVLNGQTVIVENPAYLCSSSYAITGVEELGEGRYRIALEETEFLLSEGQVREAEGGTLLTDTPMLKLEVVKNLFDGKMISSATSEAGVRLKTAEKGKLMLADATDASAFEGASFAVYDIGPGDTWRIPVCWYREGDRVTSVLPVTVAQAGR